MISRSHSPRLCACTVWITSAIPRASFRAGMITETRRRGKAFNSGSANERMLVHVLVETAERLDELGPPEMFFGVPAARSSQPVRAFRISQQPHDSAGDIGGLRCNELRAILIEDGAVGRNIGGNDWASGR